MEKSHQIALSACTFATVIALTSCTVTIESSPSDDSPNPVVESPVTSQSESSTVKETGEPEYSTTPENSENAGEDRPLSSENITAKFAVEYEIESSDNDIVDTWSSDNIYCEYDANGGFDMISNDGFLLSEDADGNILALTIPVENGNLFHADADIDDDFFTGLMAISKDGVIMSPDGQVIDDDAEFGNYMISGGC